MSASNVEDDDNWLYGEGSISTEDNSQQETKTQETDTTVISAENGDAEKPPGEESPQSPSDSSKEVSTIEKASNDATPVAKGSDSEDEDDDDDDDEVQVTIGDIKNTPPQFPPSNYGTTAPPPVNLNLKRSTASSNYSSGDRTKSLRSAGSLDPELVGSINGIPLYDFNLDSLEDKPWRKPGADITDYFNYGFTEDTWRSYCEKQKKLRTENNAHVKVVANSGKDNLIAIPTVNENSKYASHLGLKKAGPPPGRKMSGNIDVIGAASLPSRRPSSRNENVIQVMGGRKYELPLGLPPLHLPPPHYPPPYMAPPPDVSMPPPSMAPPPIVAPTVIGTPSSYSSSTTDMYTTDQYNLAAEDSNYYSSSSSNWQSSSREASDKHRYSSYDDDYDRKRHRDHDRSKDRDRYDREDRYERDRRHRSDHRSDKEDRRSSRRRHHHDDDDHRSSRHKHKRSKRDREETSDSKSKDSSVPKETQDDNTLEEGEEKD